MDFNAKFKKQLIKKEPEAVDAFFDSFADKAYSYAYLFSSSRLTAEQAVRESFSVFFNKTAMLLKNASVTAAYFAVLKAWCDKKAAEQGKENAKTLFDSSELSEKNQLSSALLTVLSQLNKKERSLFILADVISLPREVLCEIYDAEAEDVSVAVFLCREKVREVLTEIGDFSVNIGKKSVKDIEKKKISDFLDGELSADEHDLLFSNPELSNEKREYLHTLRLIRRGSSELLEKAPDHLKASSIATFIKTAKMQRKSRAFSALWIVLTVLLAAWIFTSVYYLMGGFNLNLWENPETTSSEPASSSPEVNPSLPSSSDVTSSEVTSSDSEDEEESSVVYDYSTYLPYGIDEYLTQEFRGETFSYVLICRGKNISIMTDNRESYGVIYKDNVNELSPEGVTVLYSVLDSQTVKDTLLQNHFVSFEIVSDTNFEGISANAEKGLIFVRYLDI